jgi:endoglucanase
MIARSNFSLLLVVVLAAGSRAAAADAVEYTRRFFAVPAVSGNEAALAAEIVKSLPASWTTRRDNLGGLYASPDRSGPGLVVLAALDEFGYVVSAVEATGHLRLDRASTAPLAISESFLMGHAVTIQTRTGALQGIVVQPAMHLLSRERREQLASSISLDSIYVDIGAKTDVEARARGVEILDPVSFLADVAVLANGRWSGPALGGKAISAALAAAAADLGQTRLTDPGPTFVWAAQTRLTPRGMQGAALGAVRARNLLSPRWVIVVDTVASDRDEKGPVVGKGLVLAAAKEGPSVLKTIVEVAASELKLSVQNHAEVKSALLTPFAAGDTEAVLVGLPVRFLGTPSEVVELKEIQAMADLVAAVCRSGRVK